MTPTRPGTLLVLLLLLALAAPTAAHAAGLVPNSAGDAVEALDADPSPSPDAAGASGIGLESRRLALDSMAIALPIAPLSQVVALLPAFAQGAVVGPANGRHVLPSERHALLRHEPGRHDLSLLPEIRARFAQGPMPLVLLAGAYAAQVPRATR